MGRISHAIMPHCTTYEEGTNYRFKHGHGGVFKVPARTRSSFLTLETFEHLKSALNTSMPAPLPETFLADADHFLKFGLHHDIVSELQRAVLLAAIACELKVKVMVKEKASLNKDTFGEIESDDRISIAAWFDKKMKTEINRSLKEENHILYQKIASDESSLFQNRNAIVHGGLYISAEIAKINIQSAHEIFKWLDNL